MKLIPKLLPVTLALLCTAALASAIPGRGVVEKVEGTAHVTKPDGTKARVAVGTVIGAGDVITTEKSSWMDVYLGVNGENLRLTQNTSLKVETLDIANVAERRFTTLLRLTAGRIFTKLSSLPDHSQYEIVLPKLSARLRANVRPNRCEGPEESADVNSESCQGGPADDLHFLLEAPDITAVSFGAVYLSFPDGGGLALGGGQQSTGGGQASPLSAGTAGAFAGGGGSGGGGGMGGGGGGLGALLGQAGLAAGIAASDNFNPGTNSPKAP